MSVLSAYGAADRLTRSGGNRCPGGDVHTVTDPLSRATTLAYDGEDRATVVSGPSGRVTTTGYDAEGEATTVTDRIGRRHHDVCL